MKEDEIQSTDIEINKDEIPGADEPAGQETFKDLNMDPEVAKELDSLEGRYGIRPDFIHRGHPGFYARDEEEWFRNMKASRQRIRFGAEKIKSFMRSFPGQDFYVRNPNKGKDFCYGINRRKR